jgi:hypothetical protein
LLTRVVFAIDREPRAIACCRVDVIPDFDRYFVVPLRDTLEVATFIRLSRFAACAYALL